MVRFRALIALLTVLALFTWVFYQNAWMGDDPYVTFRTIDNWVNGYGITWNPAERVQAYTHPLWMILLAALYTMTREAFFTTLTFSWILDIAALILLWRLVGGAWWRFVLLALLCICSKAFIDYCSSGLENPLSHLIAIYFFGPLLLGEPKSPDVASCRRAVVLASLAFINRADTILVYVPILVWMFAVTVRTERWRLVGWMAICASPAVLWHLFATIYYGFPFPNTAYSKLNGGRFDVPFFTKNALVYFQNSLAWDPLTLPVIAAGCVVGVLALRSGTLRSPRVAPRVLTTAGVLFYLIYVVRIGGDYMSGRLFALPFLLSTLMLAAAIPTFRSSSWIGAVACCLGFVGPRPPLIARHLNDIVLLHEDPSGVRDERGEYHRYSTLVRVIEAKDWYIGVADKWIGLRQFDRPITVWGAIGYYGFKNGPNVHDVDFIGLSDALVARIPVTNVASHWGRGHLMRPLPAGYLESIETGDNLIVDPALHEVYENLLTITTGPIWRMSRFKAIWYANTGKYKEKLSNYSSDTHVR